MKQLKLAASLLLLASAGGAWAQTNSTASGTALGNLQGNNQGVSQAVTFDSPGMVTSNINYSGSQTIKNVPSVGGPNLTTSNDTCMGSSSAGANGPGIGLSFGTTWTDDQCKRLKMSRELWNKGMKAASLAMDCMDPAARAALEMTGTKCPQSMTQEERVAAFGPGAQPTAAAPAAAPSRPTAAAAPAAVPAARAEPEAPAAPTASAAPRASAPATSAAPAAPVPAAIAALSLPVGTAAAAAARARLAQRYLAALPLEEAVLTSAPPDADGGNRQQVAALTGMRP